MPLPAPNLDDRRFQDLVDDAKRWVMSRNNGWTDHNVSDPGVTLIEAFALQMDQLLYRLNRVPDRLYVKFLELIGVKLHPPGAANAEVTFLLTAPQRETVSVPVGTEVATARTESTNAVVFVTTEAAHALPTSLAHVATGRDGERPTDRERELVERSGVPVFGSPPTPGDCLYLGLDQAAPWCVVTLRLQCPVSGVGVDPDDPPLRWEAFCGERGWLACDVERDGTGGFNKPGDVVLHLPRWHTASLLGRYSAGWLRCRLIERDQEQATYREPPVVVAAEAFTIGVDATVINAELVRDEELGVSDGTPGQRFATSHAPIVPTAAELLLEVSESPETSDTPGWTRWSEVDSFASSGPGDRHFAVDLASGQISFGPAVRLEDGRLRQYGRIPPLDARVRLTQYSHGGGASGNVGPGLLVVMKSPVKLVGFVTNRRAARGGVDAETVEEAMSRGSIELRTIDRAVTAEDVEHLVRREAPEIARVRCLTAEEGDRPGAVRVLLVPHVPPGAADGTVPFRHFEVDEDLRERIRAELDSRRVVGSVLLVDEPVYRWVMVVARVQAKTGYRREALETALQRSLHGYLHAVSGGPDGTGWPFGRPLHTGEVYATFQRQPGVEFVEQVRLFEVDHRTGRPDPLELTSLDLLPNQLLYSFRHDIVVVERQDSRTGRL